MEIIQSLNKFNKKSPLIIGCEKYAVRVNCPLTEDELFRFLDKEPAYVLMNKIMHMDDLDDALSFLERLKDKVIKGIIFSDLGVYQMAKRLDMGMLLIYDPSTLITNTMDVEVWEGKIKGVFISPFISLSELKAFKSSLKLFMVGYGYLPLFYSRRPLVTNYCLYNKIDIDTNHLMHLHEEFRDGLYPIIENDKKTIVFTPYIFNLSKYLKELENIDYIIIDYLMIEEDVYERFLKAEYKENESLGFLEQKIIYKK